jgi:hypothetical protein
MRRIPSVDPEHLRKLCKFAFRKRGAFGTSHLGVSADACIRYLELRRRFYLYMLPLLPRFIQTPVLKRAATVPLESGIPEVIEEANAVQP